MIDREVRRDGVDSERALFVVVRLELHAPVVVHAIAVDDARRITHDDERIGDRFTLLVP